MNEKTARTWTPRLGLELPDVLLPDICDDPKIVGNIEENQAQKKTKKKNPIFEKWKEKSHPLFCPHIFQFVANFSSSFPQVFLFVAIFSYFLDCCFLYSVAGRRGRKPGWLKSGPCNTHARGRSFILTARFLNLWRSCLFTVNWLGLFNLRLQCGLFLLTVQIGLVFLT